MNSPLRQFDKPGAKANWIAHEKPGGKAAQRRLRQRAALEAKQRRQAVGLPVDEEGRTPAGLIVPGFERHERRQAPSMGGVR